MPWQALLRRDALGIQERHSIPNGSPILYKREMLARCKVSRDMEESIPQSRIHNLPHTNQKFSCYLIGMGVYLTSECHLGKAKKVDGMRFQSANRRVRRRLQLVVMLTWNKSCELLQG